MNITKTINKIEKGEYDTWEKRYIEDTNLPICILDTIKNFLYYKQQEEQKEKEEIIERKMKFIKNIYKF